MRSRCHAARWIAALAAICLGLCAVAQSEVEDAVTRLDTLRWSPKWISHMGCIKGCLDYLGVDVTDAWLYGGTGHAFVLNIHDVVCPSGPTAWDSEMINKLGLNVGFRVKLVTGHAKGDDFKAKQREAFDLVKAAIDRKTPCFGWELGIPEYYVIYGYDDTGYLYRGPLADEGEGPKPWDELANTDIGALMVGSVEKTPPADAATTVREALAFAVEIAESPSKWIWPKYTAGPAGYGVWIDALENGTADGFGTAYNAACWAECRGYAAQFLREAAERLGPKHRPLFDEAIAHYDTVAQHLKRVADLFPFMGTDDEAKTANVRDPRRVRAAIGHLRVARAAEEAALATLREIVKALEPAPKAEAAP